jgi:hypothetical protein
VEDIQKIAKTLITQKDIDLKIKRFFALLSKDVSQKIFL